MEFIQPVTNKYTYKRQTDVCSYPFAQLKNCVYKVDEETETAYIMRLFHGRQDYERLI